MPLTDQEVRRLAHDILTAPTARDKQTKIGASNLANGCDFCLASNLMGDMRETPMLDRAYLGRTIGTGIHGYMEKREKGWLTAAKRGQINAFAQQYPDARIEKRIRIGRIPGYGLVGSTPDISLPGECHCFDWKGSTRKKSAITRDFLAIDAGKPAIFGRQHKAVKLSEREYEKELVKAEYKVTGYYGQLQLYMLGLNNEGVTTTRGTIVFINRDGTGWWDNPSQDGFEDDQKMRDIWTISFDFNPEYAQMVWDRGLWIWQQLRAGESVDSFARNEHCFPCSLDARDAAKAEAQVTDLPVSQPVELKAAA